LRRSSGDLRPLSHIWGENPTMSPTRSDHEAIFGTVLEGLYRIDGLIGEGGMGAVYMASHLRLGRRVAVKLMGREFATNEEALARFYREAQVTSCLGHPHIVQVLDFSTTTDGNPFIVMEFLEGEDLDHRLRRACRLPAATVAHIVKQVASALTATHSQGIVHRDLKPGNIYLLEVAGETDFVKVLDFGISKVRSAATKLTRAAEIIGTPNYMSPEQALGRVDEIDDRTDQWALACIAWESLVGRCLFLGDSAQSVLFQVVHEATPHIDTTTMDFPAQVEHVLRKALAKDKNDRFANVNDFALALEGATLGLPFGRGIQAAPVPARTELIQPTYSLSTPLTSSLPSTLSQTAGELDPVLADVRLRAKWGWITLAGVVVGLLVGGIFLLRSQSTSAPIVANPPPAAPVAAAPAPAPAEPKVELVAVPKPAPVPAPGPSPTPAQNAEPEAKGNAGEAAAEIHPTRAPATAGPSHPRRDDGQNPTQPKPLAKPKSKILRTL